MSPTIVSGSDSSIILFSDAKRNLHWEIKYKAADLVKRPSFVKCSFSSFHDGSFVPGGIIMSIGILLCGGVGKDLTNLSPSGSINGSIKEFLIKDFLIFSLNLESAKN